ncbi:threo-3-hydroxy-L-aspartate ammonia-lyase [Candidatus Uabimicrobium amorphum]|uniref:Serine/threonine dehydratase n=1 Tax=Uabimicrobium amorphum TaxID=2596890 RepID=A0A5S9IKX0_UABAM|nr:threo-3-hydroxy-L-aspartate ammonia-lyase [Candidatus Uabimicrobium amorphum]BBM83397.1 serine/threonine dehydratase [Candidatus Uabimicrobium amorphum]
MSVCFDNIKDASNVLRNVVHRTPVFTSQTLDKLTNNRVFFKCENLQKMGAFKIRGAYYAMSKVDNDHVLAYSSGNHAQAMALAGKLLGKHTVIIMPEDAPQVKLDATAGYGAEIITYNRDEVTREDLAQQIAKERNLTIIPPYDHVDIVAGQGTAAKELLEDVGDLDYLLVPCGGGGLLSGSAISSKALCKECKVIGVEPEQANDAEKSFATKKLHTVHNPQTIADGARTPSLGEVTFPLVLRYVDGMLSVSEEAITDSMHLLWERMKLVVEPTGALGLAALYENKLTVTGKKIGIIISGGNVTIRKSWFGM